MDTTKTRPTTIAETMTAHFAAMMIAHGGEPADYLAETPGRIAEAPVHPGDRVALPEHRPVNQRCTRCGLEPPPEIVAVYAWDTWECPLCEHVNAIDFARQPARGAAGGSF